MLKLDISRHALDAKKFDACGKLQLDEKLSNCSANLRITASF